MNRTTRAAGVAAVGLLVLGATACATESAQAGGSASTSTSTSTTSTSTKPSTSATVDVTSDSAKKALDEAPSVKAVGTTSGPGIKLWAVGTLKPGATIDVYAECGENKNGKPVVEAAIDGPKGMDATLTPLADRPYLGGEVTVPASFDQGVAELKLTCDNMGTGLVVLESPMLSD